MDNNISERVIRVFADFKKIDAAGIKPETSFEELGFDSLDGLNLIFELEEGFDVMVPDDQAQNMKTVAQVTEGISQLLAAKEGGAAA